MIRRYRALFAVPGFARLLLSAVLGRLPSGMFSLAIILFVHARTHSFATAGVAVGAFTLTGALTGPALGALVDRAGQRRVLVPTATAQASVLLALVLLAEGGAPAGAIVCIAALAGACQPPIAGCIRALWSEVAHDGEALQTAYALDATTQEIIWTLGPLLVGFSATLLSPAAGLLLCAAMTICGTSFFAASRLSRGWRAPTRVQHTRGGALASPNLRALLATVLFAGAVIGAIEVGLPALASEHHASWSAGLLLSLFSLGSMAGGLLYSARSWQGAIAPRYRMLLFAMAIAVAPLMAVHSLLAAYPLSALAGLGLAPMLSAQFSLVGALTPAGATTEAFAWHRAATIAGMASGSALGGTLASTHNTGATFALGCTGLLLAWLLTTLWQARIDPSSTAQDAGQPVPQAVAPPAQS